MAAKKRLNLPIIFSALISSSVIEAAFTSTPGTVSGCVGGSATFTWVYDNQGDADSVVWDFGAVNVFNYQASSGNTADGAAQFAGRVTHNGDGSITLGTLTANDAGSYTCTVTYNSNPAAADSATLVLNQAFTDSISTVLTISGSTATINLGSQGGVDVEWKNEAGSVERGTTYTGEGKVTVCLTGCVSGSATACQQIDLEETTSVHGTSPVNLGTTENSEEPQNLSSLTTEFTPSSSETITRDASTNTSSQFTVTTDIVSTTRKDLDIDDVLLAAVVSSVVGGIILIVILAFVLYFLIKKIRVPSRIHTPQAPEMEGFDNKGMTQEIYSNKQRKGRNGLDSNMQGIGNYRPKSLGTSYSTPYVGDGNPVRSRSEIGNEGYVRSSSRMYPSLPYAAYYSKHNDIAAIQTRNMRYNDRYLQHGHL